MAVFARMACVCWAVGWMVACAPAAPPGPEPEGAPVLLPSLQVYTAGGTVTLVLQVTNTTDEAVPLTFPTGQTYDFSIRRSGEPIWRWSEGRAFTQAVRSERVEAGETLRYDAVWPVPEGASGEYEAVARLTVNDHEVEQATRFELP